jgi:hypothetical protein
MKRVTFLIDLKCWSKQHQDRNIHPKIMSSWRRNLPYILPPVIVAILTFPVLASSLPSEVTKTSSEKDIGKSKVFRDPAFTEVRKRLADAEERNKSQMNDKGQ